jgi:diadenosine tetraphosphate (Ap4A) HIT family hydrolase/8-oxo-dGTP pyrophosphatase MutT (NUDIX family)
MFTEFLKKGCSLCERLIKTADGSESILSLTHCSIFRGPFTQKWPGSVMAVFKRHILEQSDVRPSDAGGLFAELLDVEKAVRKTVKPARMNFVKFGNVTEHLHWHFIPRYLHENFQDKSPWELLNHDVKDLYQRRSESMPLPWEINQDRIFTELAQQARVQIQRRVPGFFSAALFLRPIDISLCTKFNSLPLQEIIQLARTSPAQWECLLMKRNYLDRAWDMIGGGADAKETPVAVLRREIHEEVGWSVSETKEVTRQWENGVLKGFLYVVKSTEPTWFHDKPARVLASEVDTVAFFPLLTLLDSADFSDPVQKRIAAFLAGEPDFSL